MIEWTYNATYPIDFIYWFTSEEESYLYENINYDYLTIT